MKKWCSILICALALAFASGCSHGETQEDDGKLRVVATTTQVADMVREIGGDRITLEGLMGPGVDPHLFKPLARDVAKLRQADIIFYNGLMLEGRMADLFAKMASGGQPVYAITDDMPRDGLLEPAEYEGHHDPHVWFDPQLWVEAIPVVVRGLTKADPANAEYYEAQGAALKEKYLDAHNWARAQIATLPEERRILITSHDAFNYFGRAYGIRVVAVQGISTVSEAGLADVSKTIEFIQANNIPAIFVETSVAQDSINNISRKSGARVGGELFSDAMGSPGKIETAADGTTYDVGTWRGMLMHNVETIVRALAEDGASN